MKENSQPKQPAVRPGLLIVLAIVLGGALYWNFSMQPKPAPVTPAPPANSTSSINPTVPTSSIGTVTNDDNAQTKPETKKTEDLKQLLAQVLKRDIFLPPSSIVAARRSKNNQGNHTEKTVWNDPKIIKSNQVTSDLTNVNNVKNDKNDKKENYKKPVLKGIIGTASVQVIIVGYQNKSYLLKLGEILPGTEYRVAEINSNTVVLLSPKGRLLLDKKGRAK